MSCKLLVPDTGLNRGGRIFFLLCCLRREGAFSSSAILRESSLQSFSCRNDGLERRLRHVNHSFADPFLNVPQSFLILFPLLLVPSHRRAWGGWIMPPSPSCIPFLVCNWRLRASGGLVLQCASPLLLHHAGPVLRMVIAHDAGMMPPSCDACANKEPKDPGCRTVEKYVRMVGIHLVLIVVTGAM